MADKDPDKSQNAVQKAWYTSFFLENHLDYVSYPDQVASPEKIRFIVMAEEKERYYPCSDRMFGAIMARQRPAFLARRYDQVLARLLILVESQIEDPGEQEFLESLLRTKFRHETADGLMIPSRLEKRLLKIFLDRTQITDPCLCQKAARNRRAAAALGSETFLSALNRVEGGLVDGSASSIGELRLKANQVQLKRLFSLLAHEGLWEKDTRHYAAADYEEIMSRPLSGAGVEALDRLLAPERSALGAYFDQPLKIMWLMDEAGEALIDLYIIRFLAGLGHKVVIAFKDGPFYTKVDFHDARHDEAISPWLSGAFFITDKSLAKNDLVDLLKRDQHILALSDGTMEDLNLLMVTTTFARAFKEADLVVARGDAQRRRFFDTHFGFTQDILSIARAEDGSVSVEFKPRHTDVIKFSLRDLEKRAADIINAMKKAKDEGMTVVFYSGIIGSIPGKIDTAKKVMTLFVARLREQSTNTFIVNPSEYFEQGMDADDLMYMWEIVQRSGYIDIWRFQTYDDIVEAFDLMETKVPPEWVGKDATFSTGCTKEMKIAVDVVRKYPEMQIIGPPLEKFGRRGEYGVGKLYDQRLADVCGL